VTRHALVVADGDVAERRTLDARWAGWADGVDLVVAADAGALRAEALGFRPDLVVGDADSLTEADVARFRATGIDIELASTDKDESDTELAVRAALSRGAQRLTIVGALGGRRFDHALANVSLLALPELATVPTVLLDASSRISLLRSRPASSGEARLDLRGPAGEIVTLLPWGGDVRVVTTTGLRYPLDDETLRVGPSRGLSNVRVGGDASVTIADGALLVIQVA